VHVLKIKHFSLNDILDAKDLVE